MSTFKLNEIISATDGAVLKKVYTEFSGVNTDTRKIVAGEIKSGDKIEVVYENDAIDVKVL